MYFSTKNDSLRQKAQFFSKFGFLDQINVFLQNYAISHRYAKI